jgi:hypothetical protein
MQVDDPYAMLLAKFDKMCDYVEDSYAGVDVASLRALPGPVLLRGVREHLVPHMALLKSSTGVSQLKDLIPDGELLAMAAQCAGDDKVRRYLLLFCELCE